jgi:hypothetical protein
VTYPSSASSAVTGVACFLPEWRPLCRSTAAYQWRRSRNIIMALRTRLLKKHTASLIDLIWTQKTTK